MGRKRTQLSKNCLKTKKVVSLATKLDVLRRFKAGEKAVYIGKALNLAATTVRTICSRDAIKIKELSAVTTQAQCTSTFITRNPLLIKMESLLSTWIEEQTQKHMPLSKMIIQAKAIKIFNDIQENIPLGSKSVQETFSGSDGWFDKFKSRANLHNIVLKGEAASADHSAANEFLNVFKAVVQEGGYTSKQIFNVDETALFWKRLPKRTYISKEESAAPGFKSAKDRLTLLLGGNANGDYKLKPLLVYHSENPRALKGINKRSLPVYWYTNKKAWVTGIMFSNWVTNNAIPEFKKYCEKEKIDFKILVVLDNAPGHPRYLDDINENVKFLFMPPNTTSLIQPMDQGVISNFKSYYLRRVFKQLLGATDEKEGISIKQFWKDYNILKALKNIDDSWKEVKASCMNGVWRKIWPECVTTELPVNEVPLVITEISGLARKANFEGMDETDIDEVLNCEDVSISTKDLAEIVENNIINEVVKIPEPQQKKTLTTNSIAKGLKLIFEGLQVFTNEDPNEQRSARVMQDVKESISCYEKLHLQMKQTSIQTTLHKYIQSRPREDISSEDDM